jgi:glycosyltransferase involved in cell wall biosynthesis
MDSFRDLAPMDAEAAVRVAMPASPPARIGRVALVDPSNFSIPYDVHLAGGLRMAGWETDLYGRVPRESEPRADAETSMHEFFSRQAERLMRAGVNRKLASLCKAAELPWDYARLTQRLIRSNTDVLHVQWLVLPMIERRWLRNVRRRWPVVMTVHDTTPFLGSPTSKAQGVGWRETLDCADHLIVHTEQSAEAMTGMGVPRSRLSVIPHGLLQVVPSPSGAARALPYVDKSRTLCVLVGNLKPYKGIDILFEAVARLPADVRKRLQVVVAGKPMNTPEELESSVRALGIGDTVELQQRFLPDDELSDLLRASAIVAFPYRAIDASGVFLMVAGMGKAVFATSIGVFAETLRDGHSGLIVRKESVDDVAAALTRLVRDPGLAESLGRTLQNDVKRKLAWDEIGRMTGALYERLLEARGDRRVGGHGSPGRSAPR